MSKSSSATAPKHSTPLPQQSAWARGPPNSSSAPSPRSQSPAPLPLPQPVATSHSRRPSNLGHGVSFKDGVAGARSPVGAPKPGSAVTFGSIDDTSATISSSPASVPPIKTEAPKIFGTVAATPAAVSVNGKPPVSSSASVSASAKPAASTLSATKPSFNVKSLFMTSSSGPASPIASQPSSDALTSQSPSTRPLSLPQHPPPPSQPSSSHTPQSAQFSSHSFQTFVPGSGLRPQPNGANPNGPPRSPVYSRPPLNGTTPPVPANGRPQGPPGTPGAPPTPMSANMPSPRMGPPHAAAPQAMPPGQPVTWQYYYYPGMPDYMYPQPHWPMAPHVVQPPPQHSHTPGVPPPPPHQPHPQPGMPMSPRHPPTALHPPGTPSISPAVPSPVPAPSPHMHPSPLSSVTSPPATPASANGPGAAGIMDRNAKPFVPGRKVTIKNDLGLEVNLESFKKHTPHSSTSGFQSPIVVPSSPARKVIPIRMETEEAKQKRLADEERQRKEKEEQERVKKEAEDKAKQEHEERLQRDKEAKEAAERKQKDEVERKKREAEEAERRKKEEEEENERLQKEEEERERLRKEEEEKERLRKEAEERERLRKEEEERLRIEQQEAEKEKERLAKEVEAAARAAEEQASAAVPAPVESPAEPDILAEQEDGEVEEPEKDADKDESRDKVSDRPPLRLDTSLDKKRPGPLDLSGTKGPLPSSLPSALASARIIDDINRIDYPEGIKSPRVELNVNAKEGKFRYDRDFLLQFMAFCKEKPDSLPPLDAIGLEPADQSYPMSRGGSGRRQSSVSMGPPSSTAPRQASHGLGISVGGKASGNFNMGQFSTPGAKMSSDERFAMSNRSTSMSGGPAGLPFGRPIPMQRSSSQGGPGVPVGSNRTRSKRGEKRNTNTGPPQPYQNAAPPLIAGLEPIAPLEMSANRWTPASVAKKPQPVSEDSPEMVERKVKGLLNKLTMERFDSISDQIITWANRSEKEKDGRTLIQVIKLVFEKATDEATWSEMYARLCRKMMEQISPKVQDDGIRNPEGKHITGGHLFRKYLLNRCQEDFERGWASKESTAAAAASKASEDQAAKAAAENGADEAALYSEEYYAAQKAKRQGLGLIKFIGELFKLQMLTERIMHECVKKLLGNVANPEEEEIESLCKLLSTVGSLLDTTKARAHMDVYFGRMKELTKSPNVNSRMQYMLQDVLELRERGWVPRKQAAAPTTIAAVHEAAAKEKAAAEKEQYQRTLSMSRGGSRRGGERGEHVQIGPDGWAVAGGSQPRPPPKAGDLSQFGKISKTASMTFGPSSVFTSKKEGKREPTISRTGNMFSMLSQNSELASEVQAPSKSSRPPSRKPSLDLGSGSAPEVQAAPAVRKRLVLQPRTVTKSEEKTDETPAASAAGSEDEGAEGSSPAMSEEQALKQIDEDVKELMSVRNVDEAEEYFVRLPVEHRHRLVDKLTMHSLEAKEDIVNLVAEVFTRAASRDLCSAATFEEGFAPAAEMIDDIAIDAPKAFAFFVKLLKSAGIDTDEERRTRLASNSVDSDKMLTMLTS